MLTAGIIIFILSAALWLFAFEYPALFSVYVPTCAVRRVQFKVIVGVFLLLALPFGGSVADSVSGHFSYSHISDQTLMIILVSAFITLTLLKLFSLTGSVCYAVLGALEAWRISSGNYAAGDTSYYISFLAAPIAAFALSYAFGLVLRRLVSRSHIHFITLSHYMRITVIVAMALTAFALGLNWRGFLSGCASFLDSAISGIPVIALVWTLIMFLFVRVISDRSDENAGKYNDFTVYTLLATGFSVALTLLLFSFESSAAVIGLKAVPLSAGTLVAFAMAGVGLSQKSALVEPGYYFREIASMVAAPLGSMLFAFILLYVTGENDAHFSNFLALSAAMVVLAALLFAGYARTQRQRSKETERLVYSQQQQIYEHSRALNDMEIKVVLSENQALHNSLEMKRQQVMNVALSIVEQKEYLESLNDIVKRLSAVDDADEKDRLIAELRMSLNQRLSYDRDVDSQYFYTQADSLHEDFTAKLAENFPDLTQQEKRLATLLRLGFSSKYIATLMNITPKSVEISRYRLRQKLGLSRGDNLVNFIKSI